MNVLISIKPKYIEKIKEGIKTFELRKKIFKNYDKVNTIYIYSTSPIKKIVGKFNIEEIIEDHPDHIWQNYKDHLGIDKKDYFNYFKGKEKGFAIKIRNLNFFRNPIDPKKIFPNFIPPQSYCFLRDEIYKLI